MQKDPESMAKCREIGRELHSRACFKKNSSLDILVEIIISLVTFNTQKPVKNFISSLRNSDDLFSSNSGSFHIFQPTFHHITLFYIQVTKSSVSFFIFFIIHHCKTAFHHCTFSFITAHFVHHCMLKQALLHRESQMMA